MKTPLIRPFLVFGLAAMLGGLWPIAAQEPTREQEPGINVTLAEPASQPALDLGQNTADTQENSSTLRREVVVVFGRDVELKTNETAEVLVVIGGTGKVNGKVLGPAVAIAGDLEINGSVREAAVGVLGKIKFGPQAKVSGDVVSVAGKIEGADGAKITGTIQEVGVGPLGEMFGGLREWFVQCVLKMRPLAPGVGWLWLVTAVVFLVYLLIAAVFRRPVQVCVDEVRQRPATTFLIGILSLILFPLALTLIGFTLVGLLVVPFLLAAGVMAVVVGKIAIFEWIGQSLGTQIRGGRSMPWALAFVLGFGIIIVFYLVPFLGLVVYTIVTVWALGVATMGLFAGFRRELPEKPHPVAMPNYAYEPLPMMAGATAGAGAASGAWASAPGTGAVPPVGAPPANPGAPPPLGSVPPAGGPVPPAFVPRGTQLKATFWERIGAAFLDLILVGIVAQLVNGMPFALLVALAYFAGMWAWRGTTIGGIVLGIRVVRLDGKPVNLLVGIVRGLAAAFSTVVLFLGFLWIIWDNDRQGWHDKIAGTIVVRMPRGASLVCF